jgi:hypothetical protein
VSWTRAEVLVDDLAISGTSTGIRASSLLFDFSELSLFVYARVQCACYLIRLLFNEYTCIAKVLRNLQGVVQFLEFQFECVLMGLLCLH